MKKSKAFRGVQAQHRQKASATLEIKKKLQLRKEDVFRDISEELGASIYTDKNFPKHLEIFQEKSSFL